mmetsp:Transcript_27856/g.65712  ORF Transcript_27856/g.65712 Transcript_27856/m.65712 type:complete len:302 (-) Transcript_27856:850-1755(-)
MGHCMQEGEGYEDAFVPVPHATSARIIIAMAAADDLELHSCYLAQAFIQAKKLPEGVNGCVFIHPPKGSGEDDDVVFEVCRPLYGIHSSACALHLTLTKWFKSQGFVTAGFKDSIWVREAGGEYKHRLIVSAHIDDTLMACKSLETLEKFKQTFLTRFEGTDEGGVSTYLGAELICYRVNHTITFKQSVYARKSLQIYCAWDATLVKQQLEAGTSLSKEDSPAYVDQAVHSRYHCITGHLSFLVTMTRCDLAFAYAELSKFVQCPGEPHLQAAERVLCYLSGTYDLGLTYGVSNAADHNVL